jgi:hypothetical protein
VQPRSTPLSAGARQQNRLKLGKIVAFMSSAQPSAESCGAQKVEKATNQGGDWENCCLYEFRPAFCRELWSAKGRKGNKSGRRLGKLLPLNRKFGYRAA